MLTKAREARTWGTESTIHDVGPSDTSVLLLIADIIPTWAWEGTATCYPSENCIAFPVA